MQIRKKLETVLKKCSFLSLLRHDRDNVSACDFPKPMDFVYGCTHCGPHKVSLLREIVEFNLTGIQNCSCLSGKRNSFFA